MFKLYYASAIDTCVEEAFKQIEEFKKLFSKYTERNDNDCLVYLKERGIISKEELLEFSKVKHPIQVFGAGFNESPIIGPESSDVKKGAVVAYDYRLIRGCDILLVNTDLNTYCAGTLLEMEYARNLGLYIILLVPEKPKNIFLTSLANKVIYSIEELEEVLKDLTK